MILEVTVHSTEQPTVLTADTPVRAKVDMDGGGRVGFKIDVPDDVVLMTIKVSQTPVGLEVMPDEGRAG